MMKRSQTHPVPFEAVSEWPRSIERSYDWSWSEAAEALNAGATIRFDTREVYVSAIRAAFFASYKDRGFRAETRSNGNYLYVRKVTKK